MSSAVLPLRPLNVAFEQQLDAAQLVERDSHEQRTDCQGVPFVDVGATVKQNGCDVIATVDARVLQRGLLEFVGFVDTCFLLDEQLHSFELAVHHSADQRGASGTKQIDVHALCELGFQSRDVTVQRGFVNRVVRLKPPNSRNRTTERRTASGDARTSVVSA